MNLAPIVLFVYNRPEHTRLTLEALRKNELANKSILYVFADGPKNTLNANEAEKILEVRKVVAKEKWCGEVIISESATNKGLANSIIEGIGLVINRYNKVIVLEDDIQTSSGFLDFMNNALDYYNDDERVAGISGYSYPGINSTSIANVYFLPIGSSWGWATWKRQWDDVNFNAKEVRDEIVKKNLEKVLDFGGSPYFSMLNDQVNNKIDSWAIRFYASFFLQKKTFVYPSSSLVKNIGFDSTATHTKIGDNFLSSVEAKDIKINLRQFEYDQMTELVRKSFENQLKESTLAKISSQLGRMKAFIKRLFNLVRK
jgi:hypothetical protein